MPGLSGIGAFSFRTIVSVTSDFRVRSRAGVCSDRMYPIRFCMGLLMGILISFEAQAEDIQIELAKQLDPGPWTHSAVRDASSDFDFIVVTDRTGEHREGVFRRAMAKTNLVQPAFVFSVG